MSEAIKQKMKGSPGGLQGILRSPDVARGVASASPGSPKAGRRASGVHFAPPHDLKGVLARYYAGEDRAGVEKALDEYATRNLQGPALVAWLQDLVENVVSLKPELEAFVTRFLRVQWVAQDAAVVGAFRHFLANLVSAHGHYTRHVMLMLVQNLAGKARNEADLDLEAKAFDNVHGTIQKMLELSPLGAKSLLLQLAKESMPKMFTYHEDQAFERHSHTKYIENLTRIISYLDKSEDRVFLLRIIVDRLVQLDAYLPMPTAKGVNNDSDEESEDEDNEIFPMENDKDKGPDLAEVAREKLDAAMSVMFVFLKQRHNSEER